MWDLQNNLPSDARPLMLTIYSDKTKLSTFSNVSGYPIMARIENLPSNFKNGQGLGATQVVGWLPVIPEDPAEHGKTDFVNFKRELYHQCLRHLFSSIATESHVGGVYDCGGCKRVLYPMIFILAADYEE
ncbi:hypothetical protein H0H92_015849, partial [Tricholoma furcatifolium]